MQISDLVKQYQSGDLIRCGDADRDERCGKSEICIRTAPFVILNNYLMIQNS